MTSVIANISMSLDGYIAGPNDVPGTGLGIGAERLHFWAFGGPWTYEDTEFGQMTGVDKEYYDRLVHRGGAVVVGRRMYDNSEAWGGKNPFPVPLFVVTHRTEEQPPAEQGFDFVGSLDEGLRRAREAAGGKAVFIAGGASVIRQGLDSGQVDELWLSIAPFTLGAGVRLFDGLARSVDLEPLGAVQSRWATHVGYRVIKKKG